MRPQAGQNKDARSNNRADSERSQMDRPQRAPQRMLAALLRLLHKHLHRFFRKKWIRHEALQYACGLNGTP